MIHVTKYQCEICQTIHDTEAEARNCEARGVTTPRFAVGETVYALHRYPPDKTRQFGIRTIIAMVTENRHSPDYVFNEAIQTGKETWIGSMPSAWDNEYGFKPANEYDNHLFKLGDLIPGDICALIGVPLGTALSFGMVDLSL